MIRFPGLCPRSQYFFFQGGKSVTRQASVGLIPSKPVSDLDLGRGFRETCLRDIDSPIILIGLHPLYSRVVDHGILGHVPNLASR